MNEQKPATEDAERLQQIRERCENATPGPWENRFNRLCVTQQNWHHYMPKIAECSNFTDGDFIAHARTDIPFLLQAIAERDAEVERLRELREMILREVPELEREGFENIWGYLVHWDEIIKVCNQAWPTPRGYSQSPVELIIAIINERDQLRAQVAELQGKGKE